MAEVKDNVPFTDALSAISQGKRHLLVRDYSSAVTAFAEGLELLSGKHGDCADELGEPYLLYGRALLGLAREEAGILGDVPNGTEETKNESDGDEADADGNEDDDENEDEDENNTGADNDDVKENGKDKEDVKEGEAENKTDKEAQKETAKEDKSKEAKDDVKEEKPATSSDKESDSSKENDKKDAKDDNNTIEEEEEDDVNKEDEDEEDPGRGLDLQVAWEVLELAKIVFEKRGSSGLKQLAETHRLLGEVAMESGNVQVAVSDLERAIKILDNIETCDPRAMAELHYQLGLAFSLLNEFDASIKEFNEATVLLNSRINQLENMTESPNKDNPFYTIEGEIKELKELLPEIQEKITDMKDYKDETRKLLIESIKNKTPIINNGESSSSSSLPGPSSSSSSSSNSDKKTTPKEVKPINDISHLIRKKRKADENTEEPPVKKPTP